MPRDHFNPNMLGDETWVEVFILGRFVGWAPYTAYAAAAQGDVSNLVRQCAAAPPQALQWTRRSYRERARWN